LNEQELIHDWNQSGGTFDWSSVRRVELDDETLRDGLQNPSVVDPPIEDKIRLLHLMDGFGIHTADIGLPGAGPRAVADVTALAREIVEAKLAIRPNCAARTVIADIEPICDVADEVGIPIEVSCFIGSSPIRQYAEDWSIDTMLAHSEKAVRFATDRGMPVMYVT
jgi:2-isopropylmalate synthase